MTRKISNFEYLMIINIFSGRSFNDLSQYPFFPWIIKDYDSSNLNLYDVNIYRPLNKSIGSIDSIRLKKALQRYNDFIDDEIEHPCMFSTGPITMLSVCLYLTRMEPFTTLHVQLQGGKFDLPDRLMNSIRQMFQGIIHGNAESWELSPEFFFQTEFLTNDNDFNFGFVDDEKVDSVELPKWCSSPFDFIYKHRKVLESDFVSDHINEWIDMNFGILQKSVEKFNVYDDKLYENVWDIYNNKSNINLINSIEATLQMIGQIPPKIFPDFHPKRKKRHNIISNDDNSSDHVNNKFDAIHSLETINDFKVNEIVTCLFSNGLKKRILLSLSKISKKSITDFNSKANTYNNLYLSSFEVICKKEEDNIIFEQINKEKIFFEDFADDSDLINTIHKSNSNENSGIYKNMKKNSILRLNNEKFAMLGHNKFVVFSYSNNKFDKLVYNLSSIKNIASSNCWLICCKKEDSVLHIFQNEKLLISTRTYRDVITCCAVSDLYKITVIGTKDGGLIVGNLPSGITVRVLELGKNEPKKVLITPGWGFIVAYVEHYNASKTSTLISSLEINSLNHNYNDNNNDIIKNNTYEIIVHSLNGLLIKRIELKYPVDDWIVWKSKSGFDFIAIVQGNKISYFEVYFMERCFLTRTPKIVIGFTYIEEIDTFLFVDEDGKIQKLVFPIDDLYVGR